MIGRESGNACARGAQGVAPRIVPASVRAGLIEAGALAGYRNIPVYLCGSRHVPPRWEVVRDAMPALFDLLEQETEPGVRAVLGPIVA